MEEDEDALRNELKEAFRIYDKEEKGYTTQHSSVYTLSKLHSLYTLHTDQATLSAKLYSNKTTLSVYVTHWSNFTPCIHYTLIKLHSMYTLHTDQTTLSVYITQ